MSDSDSDNIVSESVDIESIVKEQVSTKPDPPQKPSAPTKTATVKYKTGKKAASKKAAPVVTPTSTETKITKDPRQEEKKRREALRLDTKQTHIYGDKIIGYGCTMKWSELMVYYDCYGGPECTDNQKICDYLVSEFKKYNITLTKTHDHYFICTGHAILADTDTKWTYEPTMTDYLKLSYVKNGIPLNKSNDKKYAERLTAIQEQRYDITKPMIHILMI